MFTLNNVVYKTILNISRLTIHEAKITSIVGESGSGKTTLLRLLNKLISLDSGDILYKNKSLKEISSVALRREVVMLSQNSAIFPGNIRDNLNIGLKFSEKPIVTDDKLNEILSMVSLKKALDDDAEKLSGGEKQRLTLGRVILMDPDVFLLDEPSSALDEDTEKIVIEKLVSYTKSTGKTLVMVTHSMKIAEDFSDNIIQIKNGKVISEREV